MNDMVKNEQKEAMKNGQEKLNETTKSENEMQKQKELFMECFESLSTPGLSNVAKRQSIILRIMWIMAFLTCVSLCAYTMQKTIINYLNYPTTINILVADERLVQFPTVTLCNLNPFNYDNQQVRDKLLSIANNTKLIMNATYLYGSLFIINNNLRNYVSELNDSEKIKFGNQLDDMMLFCSFNSIACDSSDFQWFYDFFLGNCYKFNANGRKFVGKIGIMSGLKLQLVVDDDQPVPYQIKKGLRVVVHNSTLVKPMVYENGIDLAPGFEYSLDVKRIYFDRLPYPYNDCINDLTRKGNHKSSLMRFIFDRLNRTHYDRSFCENLAFQVNMAKNCGCIDPAYSFINGTLISPHARCLSLSQLICRSNLFQTVYSNPNYYLQDYCPSVCDYFEYDVKLSQSLFPTQWYWHALKAVGANSSLSNQAYAKLKNIRTYNRARDNLLSFNVFYESLGYTLVKETPYWNFIQLLNSIGGNLSLFVGICFLSLLELIETTFFFFVYLIKRFLIKIRTIKPAKK